MNPLVPTPLDIVLTVAAFAFWIAVGVAVCTASWLLYRSSKKRNSAP